MVKKIVILLLAGVFLFCMFAKPEFMSRSSVKKIDYKTMEHIFDQSPLPESMEISQVRYRGYSLIFNGPDGPMCSDYELLMDAKDYLPLREKLLPFRDERITSSRASVAAHEFDNDIMEYYYAQNGDFPDKEGVWPPTYFVFRSIEGSENQTWSSLIFDDRSSPTIKVYVSTRAYLSIR